MNESAVEVQGDETFHCIAHRLFGTIRDNVALD